MKRTLLVLFAIVSMYCANAQMYGKYALGIAYRPEIGNSYTMNLHFGYQFNEVLTPNGIVIAEYDQRAMTGGISPFYFGGRLGCGLITGENTSVILSGGSYYRIISGDEKANNYWIGGYGLTFLWKNVSVEVSKVEFYQASIGCHYYFD